MTCPLYSPAEQAEKKNCGTCQLWSGEKCREEDMLKECSYATSEGKL